MHYLVTGGAGFIGSHLAERLLAAGHRVSVVDDCSTGDVANLAAVLERADFTHHNGSVCDEILIDEICLDVDAIVHLAAAVGVQRILDQRVRSIVTNLRGTEVILRAATTHGRIPVFLASTSEVYGKAAKVPYAEGDDSVLGPTSVHRWSYACAKAMDEFLALAYHRERELPVRIGRFFNITGPRQSPHYGMVLPRFCRRAVAGAELEVFGDGRQTRCFLHVEDCVEAVMALLACQAAVGRVVNIGGEEEVTITGLAERVIAQAGWGPGIPRVGGGCGICYVPYADAYPGGGFEDMVRRVPDTGLLRELTAWAPQRDLNGIIADSLAAAIAEEERGC